MRALLTLTGRELKAFWYSPIAYVVGALFLLLQGWTFWLLLAIMNDPRSDPSVTMARYFFGGTFFFWLSMLLLAPLLTMRSFSEEKRTGSIELLLTAPVTDAEVVGSKFLGAWLSYLMCWAGTLALFLLLRLHTAFDWAPVLLGYLGTALLGAVLLAVGLFASSVTRNQVIAAVLSTVLLLLLFSVGVLDAFVHDTELSKIIRYCSLAEHLGELAKGVLDTRPIVFYGSATAIVLFLTGRVISHPRWRS